MINGGATTGININNFSSTGINISNASTGIGENISTGTSSAIVATNSATAAANGTFVVTNSNANGSYAINAANTSSAFPTVLVTNNNSGTGSIAVQASAASNASAFYASSGNITIPSTNTTGSIQDLSEANSNFGVSGTDGQRVTINGLKTTPLTTLQANLADYELTVNGDANITGTLTAGLLNVTQAICLTTTGSPTMGANSSAQGGIGATGVNAPTTGIPGIGILGIIADPGDVTLQSLYASCGTENVTGITAGVYGVVNNPSYFSGEFVQNNNYTSSAPAGISATALLVHSFDAATAKGRGVLVEENNASNTTLNVGIEVRNQPTTATGSANAAADVHTAFRVDARGGLVDTAVSVVNATQGMEIAAGNTPTGTSTTGFGIRVNPASGQNQPDAIVIDGDITGGTSTRGLTISSDAASNMQYAERIGTAVGNTNGYLVTAVAPQNGVDVTFNATKAGSEAYNFGYRAYTTTATAGSGAGLVVGNGAGSSQYPLEGAIIQASNTGTGIRIGTNYNTAGGSAAGVTPLTGINMTIANNGTGETVTTVGGNNQISLGFQAIEAGTGAITTGLNVQTNGGAITTGVNVVAAATSWHKHCNRRKRADNFNQRDNNRY